VPEVTVALTSDEALVLFELLHRWEDSGRIDTALMPGEQTALWALSGRLESVLMEPFEGNYRELVDHARRRLAERSEASSACSTPRRPTAPGITADAV
jgi:hypothetical protein